MKTTILTSLALCIAFLSHAITPVKGRLIDQEKAAIEFADIVLYKNGSTQPVAHVQSGPDGSFSLNITENGLYTFMARFIGYDVYQDTIQLKGLPLDMGAIQLKPLDKWLAEVVVSGEQRQVVYKLDKRVISPGMNLMTTGTAVDLLENAPSIRVDVEGNVSLRGSGNFAVYIDGKPSIYSGTQGLQQVPSSQIENIEIITNPSARHDATGDVGIINIVMKKRFQHSLSGVVNVLGSTELSNNINFLINKQNKTSQWYLGAGRNQPIRKSDFEQEKTTIVNDTTTLSHSTGPRKGDNYIYFVRAGGSYTLGQTELNLNLQGGYDKFTRTGNLAYAEQRSTNGAIFETGAYNSRDYYDLYGSYYQGDLGFSHKFNDHGHKLTGSFFVRYEGDPMEYFQSDLFNEKQERQQGHRAWEDEHRWTIRGNLDYTLPYSPTGSLDAGYQYFSYLEDGDYTMHFWDPLKKEFYNREDIYNTFYFQRGIHSIYTILSQSFGHFNAQAGLRGEHTHQVLRSSIPGSERTVNRFELFPSLHTSYNFPQKNTLAFSYSYRTTRPELYYMEPYITYRDYYTAEIGNPDIRPEYIHSFELNYKKDLGEHTLSSSIFYRNRKDKIERLRVPYHSGVTLDSMANVGHDYSLGLELNGQFKITRFWNATVNGNLYHYKVVNDFNSYKETSTNYDLMINNLFQVLKNTRVQLDGNFVGPSVTTQGRSDAYWYMNLAVRQQWMQNKLSTTLSFRDIFHTAKYKNDINTANLRSITRITPGYPVITLTLSYSFNSSTRRADWQENRNLFEGTNH